MEKILKSIMETTEANMPSSPDSYMEDGILYCNVCKEPLETIINNPFTGEKKKVRCICKCVVDKMQKEEEEARNREKIAEIERLKKNSLLGSRYENVSFETTIIGNNESFNKAFERCSNYCKVTSKVLEKGYGIYMFGSRGVGKTHIAACMCNELIKQTRPVLFTNFFEISKIIRSTYNGIKRETEEDFINKVAMVDFLFIDDIGSEVLKKNEDDTWLQGVIFDVINKRYNNKKPTIFTSNHSLQELISQRGLMPKTVDRILEMSNLILKIEGKSFRMETRKTELPF